MTTQHTPGPWEVGYCTWNDEGNVCYELRGIKQGGAADARLIAAAPDLLEALKRLMGGTTTLQDAQEAAQQARAAIVKATGETK